jgi:DNA replication protein DnaC
MFDDSLMIVDRCRDVDLLVLDDLGKEAVNLSLSDSTAAPFELLMKDRVASVRSTIVTTNMAKEDFKKMYGESTALAVQGVSLFVHMTIGQKRAQEKAEVAAFYGLGNTK